MSLWPLSDYMARETMVRYYAGLSAGLGRGEALRQAKLCDAQAEGPRSIRSTGQASFSLGVGQPGWQALIAVRESTR